MESAELGKMREELKKRDQEIQSLKEQLRDRSSSCQDGDKSCPCQYGDGSSSFQYNERSSSCQDGDRSSSCPHGDKSSSCQHGNKSFSCQHGDGSSSCPHGDKSSSCPHGDKSFSCPHGNKSSSCPHGDKSSSCPHGDKSSSCPHGDKSSCPHGNKSSCPHGDRSSSCPHGDKSSCPHGDKSSSCPHDDKSSSCPHGDKSSSCPHGDRSSSCPHGERSSSCPHGDRSSSCPHGDRSSSCPHGDRSSSCQHDDRSSCPPRLHNTNAELPTLSRGSLSNAEILRYSRQLVLAEFGVKGQLRLSQCSVLVVGCGGLGCPLAQYLAAAGVGRLGLLDYDEVEMSNLHRQVLHSEERMGMSKSLSMATALQQLNSTVEYVPYHMMLSPANALALISQYDVVADCSDNVPTRYLINDACVVTGKALVSASALRWEGQLTVYNYQGGPCYRCLFPTPPPPETVTNCADGGVLGVVPGIMGCLQALEVLKLACGIAPSYSGIMVLYDALDGRFRNIKLRGKRADCSVCGCKSECHILKDYEAFCGSSASDKCRMLNLLPAADRMTVQEYKQLMDYDVPHLLIDVRPQAEVDICHLPHSVHIPLSQLEARKAGDLLVEKIREIGECGNHQKKLIAICKLGNDSQKAVKVLQQLSEDRMGAFTVKDIVGGLMAWAEKVDPAFPKY